MDRSSLSSRLREEFLALLSPRVDRHPLSCHPCRIDVRVVFDRLVAGPVFGRGYERPTDAACSSTTLRRRRSEWITAGGFIALRHAVPADLAAG